MIPPGIVSYLWPFPLLFGAALLYTVQTNPPKNDGEILFAILFAVVLIVASLKAFGEVWRYNRWKKSLNPVAEDPSKKAQHRRKNLLIIGVTGWCALVYWLFFVPSASDYEQLYEIASSSFVVITIAALLWLFLRFRSIRKVGQAEDATNYVVSSSLSVPRNSPKPKDISAALPAYCQSLLKSKSNSTQTS
jgi:hypothetical protein